MNFPPGKAMHDKIEQNTKIEAPETDILRISQAWGRMRLMMGRRIIGRMAAKRIAPGLELSHMDVIDAVKRIGREGGEVTVGAIAEMMRIDPSRSSRLVSELIQRGMLERAASQADGRRTVVEPTELSRAYFREAEAFKHSVIQEIVGSWSAEDLAHFSRFFAEFVEQFESIARSKDDQ
jgi:DNA-binding MarR family transcriptional regulator